jgi:hypothetical protein
MPKSVAGLQALSVSLWAFNIGRVCVFPATENGSKLEPSGQRRTNPDSLTNQKGGSHMARPEYATHVEPYLKQIPAWYKTMSVRQIAAKLGVSKTTLYKYAKDHPELAAALEGSKAELVDDLKNSIKKRALGYTWTEVTQEKAYNEESGELVVVKERRVTKHVPADLGSGHLLLKNLDPTWHDADQITIRQREKDLDIKQQKADAAEW